MIDIDDAYGDGNLGSRDNVQSSDHVWFALQSGLLKGPQIVQLPGGKNSIIHFEKKAFLSYKLKEVC